MKRIFFRTLLAAAAAAVLFLIVVAGSQATRAPFFTTPSLSAFSSSSGITLLVRQPDSKYAQLRFGVTPPYGMLSSLESLAGIVSGGTKFSMATPPGPANVGLASQYVAIGDFIGDDSPGVAYVDVARVRSAITVHQGTGMFSYGRSATYTVGTDTRGVIAADFNRDGKTDLAVAYAGNSSNAGGVGILLNKGDGTFAASVSYTAGASPVSVAALDVNHDGFLDLAVADGSSSGSAGKAWVLLGRGDGTFGTASSYSAGKTPLSVTIADLNGDSNPDVAVTAADNTLTILLGNGNGTFRAGSSYNTGRNPGYVAAGDFDKNGRMDLAVANGSSQNVTIFQGRGDGTFPTSSTYCLSYNPESLVVTDYDGDGNLDIIQGSGDARGIGPGVDSQDIDILLGNGNGTFQGAVSVLGSTGPMVTSSFLVTGDFGGDGNADAILNDKFGGNLYLFAGDGKGKFQAPATLNLLSTGSQTGPSGAAAGDFTGDGKLDLAVTEQFAGKVAVLLNSAAGLQLAGTFASGGAVPGPVLAADFNGDRKLDLAVINAPSDDRTTRGNLTVFFGGGNGSFQLARTYASGFYLTSMVAADVNGDGKPDLVATDQSDPFVTPRPDGSVYVLLNDGAGGFGTPSKLTAGTYPYSVWAGDLNGDGKQDLVVAASNSRAAYTLMALRGNGDGSFQPPVTVSTLYGPSGVLIRDFNGDGVVDLVVSHCCGATDMTYMQGNGDGGFQPEVHFNGGAHPFAVSAGDLNGDGKLDLVIGGTQSLAVTALLNNAAPGPAPIALTSAASYATPPIAPGMLANIWWNGGSDFSTSLLHTPSADLPLSMGGVSVTIQDAGGATRDVPLLDVTPRQLNVLIPAATAVGTATITVNGYDGAAHGATVEVAAVAPGLFSATADGKGFAVGQAILAKPDGSSTAATLCCTAAGTGVPIDMGADADTVVVVLYGTGLRGRTSLSNVSATVGGQVAVVGYAGAQGGFVGLDQVNLTVPHSLKGRGTVAISFTVDGKPANALNIVMGP